MEKSRKYLFGGLAALTAAFVLLLASGRDQDVKVTAEPRDAVVLYTNDIHCGIDGYSKLAAYRRQMIEAGYETAVVDAGDFIQGEMTGSLTKGADIIALMNAVPYDLAVPGNHEFDYGTANFLALVQKSATFPVLSANFEDLRAHKPVLPRYKILTLGGRQVAFVGVCTPSTYTSSTPKYFEDEKGRQIYGFGEKDFVAKVQAAVDRARQEGAEIVVLLAHLGINGINEGWRSIDVIARTRGIDAVIDGHSHEAFAGEVYKNADGKDVTVIATGMMVQLALKARETMAAEGVSVRVIDMHTIKPLDTELVLRAAQETGCIVTSEEHSIIGGLGGAVAEVVCETVPVPVLRVGVNDTFGKSGPALELLPLFGLSAAHIAETAREAVRRKS